MTRSGLKLAVVFAAGVWAAAFCPAADVQPFVQGDRIAFIGDSITHGGSYHSNIYLFYATRFPGKPFKVYNCGISGDTAPGANERFDEDVAALNPNKATIMLGMNDAWAWLFNPDEPVESRRNGLEKAYATYTTSMDQLAARLKEMGCETIFIKPSIYDQTAELEKPNLMGKNDLLGRYSDYIDTLADQYGGSVVDFRMTMMRVNERLQAVDPAATVVGQDRVHPAAPGHLVMTYAFLKAQGMPSLVSSVLIDGATGQVGEQENCWVEDVVVSPDGIAFGCRENALPFPVSDNQMVALDWVPFQQELNRQMLRIENLPAGRYALKIDGRSVGEWSSGELEKGINLSGNRKTPQHAQAMEVKAVNDERLEVEDKLRAVMHVRHTVIRKLDPPVDATNLEETGKALLDHLAKDEGKPWNGYVQQQIRKYLENVSQVKELGERREALLEKTWKVNQPRPHAWELVRMD